MYRKRVFIYFVIIIIMSTGASVSAQSVQKVSTFDIEHGEVVHTIPMNDWIQKEAENCLNGINGVYGKFRPIPDNGYIIKVPLEPPLTVRNQWIHSLVDEVNFIFTEQEKPYVMVFDDENHPHFFLFEGDAVRLLEKIHLSTE